MKRGFVTGIILSLLVAAGLFSAVSMASAMGRHGGDDDTGSVSETIWSGLQDGANLTFGTFGGRSEDEPAPSTSPGTESPGRGGGFGGAPSDTSASPGRSTQRSGMYVALGDSVAAGAGLPTWSDATAQDRRCDRAPEAYAFEVGRQLGRQHALYACSGASSGDLFTRQWISNTNPNIQLNQAFAQGTPDYISVTAGANDIAWRRIMQRCYAGTCGSRLQTLAVEGGLVLADRNLSRAMNQIRERSGGNPPVVVLTGYYNPASDRCTAFTQGRITATEVAWITQNVGALNRTIQNIADKYDFVRYAPVDFSGHDFCSNDSWVQGLQDEAPIHPTAAGQQAIARSVIRAFGANL